MAGKSEEAFTKFVAEKFDVKVERRMRLAIFVQKLYSKQGISLTEMEALEKLTDVSFMLKITEILLTMPDQVGPDAEPTAFTEEEAEEQVATISRLLFSVAEEEE